MSLTYMVRDNDGDLIGVNQDGWQAGKYYFWYFNNTDSQDKYQGTRFELNESEVLDLMEYDKRLSGKNVYGEFDSGLPKWVLEGIETNLEGTMDKLISYSNLQREEVIKLLKKRVSEDDMLDFVNDPDLVHSPKHYMLEDGTEVKEHIQSLLGNEGFEAYAIGNAIKYLGRYKDKGNPVQDLNKAKEYLDMVIETYDN